MQILTVALIVLSVGCLAESLAVYSLPEKNVIDYSNAKNITGAGGRALTSLGVMDGKEFFTDLSLGPVSIMEALDYCQLNNMALASIYTLNQEDTVWSQVPKDYHMWLAGTDLFNEGTWVWMKTQDQFVFIRWALGQPLLTPMRNCLFLNETLNDWWSAVCGGMDKYNVLCEQDVPETTQRY